MTWWFVCNHTNMLTSAAPVAAGDDCTYGGLDPEIPLLYMNSRKDLTATFSGATDDGPEINATTCKNGDISFHWGELVLQWFLEMEGNL
ncbi:MAG: hypothetical protein GY847_37955 [Proteobacteria bacterium]|nr:hypothetical protein [Pseudomonadota bacterium]